MAGLDDFVVGVDVARNQGKATDEIGDYGATNEAHCSLPGCRMVDFLPFKCTETASAGGCGQTYCLEHRAAGAHACTGELKKDRRAPECPLCGEPVLSTVGGSASAPLSANDAVERHIAAGCAAGVEKERRKKRCKHRRCKTVPLIPFACESCGGSFCAAHRFNSDHGCEQRKRKQQAKAAERRRRGAAAGASKSASSTCRDEQLAAERIGAGASRSPFVGFMMLS